MINILSNHLKKPYKILINNIEQEENYEINLYWIANKNEFYNITDSGYNHFQRLLIALDACYQLNKL